MSHRLPAFFMIAFLALGLPLGLLAARETAQKGLAVNYENIIKGHWTLAFDKKLPEALAFYGPSRDLWGIVDYVLFREGRKGVLVGANGWLFTDEEFALWPQAQTNIDARLETISQVHAQLKEKDITLLVALLPAKARLYPEHLGAHRWPAAHRDVYLSTLTALKEKNILAPDLHAAFAQNSARDTLFLRTDTHWAPAGARLAALTLAQTLSGIAPPLSDPAPFATTKTESRDHSGDLMRYIPLGSLAVPGAPQADRLDLFTTEKTASDQSVPDDLFGSQSIPVALVGTSYSANPLWNFAGFLKDSLKADVLNAADEGRGPFVTMTAYLKSPAFLETPPRLVIWEIPERYLAMPGKTEEQKGQEN